MGSVVDPNTHPGRFLALGLVILAIAAVLVLRPDGLPPVEGTKTIIECRPGQDPTTALCYDPALPSG